MLCAGREPRIWTTITSLTTLSLSLSLSRRWSRRPVDRRRLFSQPPFGRFHTHTQKKLPPFFFTKKKRPGDRKQTRIVSNRVVCLAMRGIYFPCCPLLRPAGSCCLSFCLSFLSLLLSWKKKVRVFVFFSVWQRCFVFFFAFSGNVIQKRRPKRRKTRRNPVKLSKTL